MQQQAGNLPNQLPACLLVASLVNAAELQAKVLFLVCVCVDNSGPLSFV